MLRLTIAIAKEVIRTLNPQFYSYDFIEKYRSINNNQYERDYVEDLYDRRESSNGIFRAYHLEIGHFLSQNARQLDIEGIHKESSTNINGNDTLNMIWRRTDAL